MLRHIVALGLYIVLDQNTLVVLLYILLLIMANLLFNPLSPNSRIDKKLIFDSLWCSKTRIQLDASVEVEFKVGNAVSLFTNFTIL